ncbi:MAG: dimethylarginine dimethylaminohydrolase family protein [Chloroflexota bacterium]
MRLAITRQVSPAIQRCELTHLDRQPIDYERACAQHRQYEQALRALGVQVLSLPAEIDLPDSVFVEDIALVLDECAILTNPGAASRRPEVASVAQALAPYRKLFHIHSPGVLDGGDVLRIGRTIYVGLSSRSNEQAVEQLADILAAPDLETANKHEIRTVRVTACLHLKSAVTQVGEALLLINPAWARKEDFPGMEFIEADPSEPYAANAVLVGETIIYPSSFPKTRSRLERKGVKMLLVEADELAKAEGAVTCCSLIFSAGA